MDGSAPISLEPLRLRSPGASSDGPLEFDGCDTLSKLFLARTRALGEKTAHMEKHLGIWHRYSWNHYRETVATVAGGLAARGLGRGCRVGILSENRKEWVYADMAGQCLGGTVAGIYQTDAPTQCEHIITDAGLQALFVENDEQLDKFLEIEARVPDLGLVIVFDMDGLEGLDHPKIISWDQLLDEGREFVARNPDHLAEAVAGSQADDVCLLVYTSGTTGKPKGTMITSRNIIAAMQYADAVFEPTPGASMISYLPLAHIYERSLGAYLQIAHGLNVCFAESVQTVFDNIREVSPEIMNGVPRVWEKIYSSVNLRMKDATRPAQVMFSWALRAGERWAKYAQVNQPVPWLIAAERWLANRLVLSNVRTMIGLNSVTRCVSGAAPISPELLRWYWALGVRIYEGWGMSETVAAGIVNTPTGTKVGTIGRAIPGTNVRTDPDSGEIQVQSDLVFAGYINLPEKTAAEFTGDGYFRTGDVGEIDDEGYVRITGRIKDIIITEGGKNVAPAETENELKFSPYITDAIVIGDGRKYLTALVMIDQENVEKYATDAKVSFSNFASLCAAPEVVALIEAEVEKVNGKFARVEQIKKIRLIDQLLTAEDEELTPTLKLKRQTVEKKYAALIEDMY